MLKKEMSRNEWKSRKMKQGIKKEWVKGQVKKKRERIGHENEKRRI